MGQGRTFPANPNLANILGRRIWILGIPFFICWLPNFWTSKFPDFQNLARAGLGPGQAGLSPSGPKNADFL